MANKKVHVFDADGEYRVHPPLIELDGGVPDTLIVRNNTSEDLVLYVGAKAFNANDPVAVPIPQGKKVNLIAVSQGGGGASNAYAYQVIAPKSGKKAKGNSDPVLIIEN
jgi:hypothetical protein